MMELLLDNAWILKAVLVLAVLVSVYLLVVIGPSPRGGGKK